ncbi:hypothetical protein DXG03_001243 [Asterophora parasitica]|uniref:AB hydrolase-1 domain-containing protein n=1 Tax=Asterophora parasitica TaxID=117018 RepID=A0A9P7KCX9_9AGAR|nr:hypothetical protein DXG03_001243 [Asterophora parasitica]
MQFLLATVLFAYSALPALGAPGTLEARQAVDNIVSITNANSFCMIMPRDPHTNIGDSEHPGGMKTYCSAAGRTSPQQGQLPAGFWRDVQYKTGNGKNGKRYAQLTGCIRPELLSRLNPRDEGGQYDSSGGVGGRGNPEGSKCTGYKHYVELVEPAGNRACIRCCDDPADCPLNKDLDYASYIPPDGNKTEGALIILHGLFGSKRNFTSLSKLFMKELNIPVYALDLRNQGTSPHALPHTYSAMAADVLHFIKSHSLSKVSLLGHSMGGKAAMSVALHPSLSEPENEDALANLIVADVSPTRAQLSPEFKGYIEAMKKIESTRVASRKEALEVLGPYEPDPSVRQFLLTNLNPITASEPHAKFRVPLDTLGNAIPEIGWFPYAPGERVWSGPTMFIKGTKSAYINRHSLAPMESFFPKLQLETLDAGHWGNVSLFPKYSYADMVLNLASIPICSARPTEFKKLVEDFIKKHRT